MNHHGQQAMQYGPHYVQPPLDPAQACKPYRNPTCCCAGVRLIASVICAHSCGGARECSGPDSCSFRQYSVRVWRGMPAARQLPMYIASRPSCSARRAASLLGCASASGSSCPIAPRTPAQGQLSHDPALLPHLTHATKSRPAPLYHIRQHTYRPAARHPWLGSKVAVHVALP